MNTCCPCISSGQITWERELKIFTEPGFVCSFFTLSIQVLRHLAASQLRDSHFLPGADLDLQEAPGLQTQRDPDPEEPLSDRPGETGLRRVPGVSDAERTDGSAARTNQNLRRHGKTHGEDWAGYHGCRGYQRGEVLCFKQTKVQWLLTEHIQWHNGGKWYFGTGSDSFVRFAITSASDKMTTNIVWKGKGFVTGSADEAERARVSVVVVVIIVAEDTQLPCLSRGRTVLTLDERPCFVELAEE